MKKNEFNLKGNKIFLAYLIGILIGLIIMCIFKKISITNVYYGITVWSAIYTIWHKILFSMDEQERDRRNHSIILVKDFDNPYMREARDFTRLFKKDHDEQNLQKGVLADFIDEKLEDKQQEQYMKDYKVNDVKKLKASLIYLFNYFQSVYAEIDYEMANKTYIMKYLGNVYLQLFDRFEVWVKRNCEDNDAEQIKDLEKLKEMIEEYKKIEIK